MNKSQLPKLVGSTVRIQPVAIGPSGALVDDDWLIADVNSDMVVLQHVGSNVVARIGFDAIYSYLSDAHGRRTPDENRGFLQLVMQITRRQDGTVTVVPTYPPRITPTAESMASHLIQKVGEDESTPGQRGLRRRAGP